MKYVILEIWSDCHTCTIDIAKEAWVKHLVRDSTEELACAGKAESFDGC